MEKKTNRLLRLEGYFDERNIKDPDLWRTAVYPELEEFLLDAMQERRPYHLHLSAHVSVAFACGYVLDPKSGVEVAPVQRTPFEPELWPRSWWHRGRRHTVGLQLGSLGSGG